jgi:hypothetical protein
MDIDIEILDFLGVSDKVREVRGLRDKAVVVGIDIEIPDVLGVNDKVREGRGLREKAGGQWYRDPGHPWSQWQGG